MHSTALKTVVQTLAPALGLLSVTANTASTAQAAWFKGNGSFVEMEGRDSTGGIYLYVYVSRVRTSQALETYVSYEIYNACTSQSLGWGSGRVSNVAFKTTKTGATLILLPSASSDFGTGGVPGSVRITWTVEDGGSNSGSGLSCTEYAGAVSQAHGSWTNQTAKATGTIFGFEIGETSTRIG
jgi:hypothetical protein